MSLISKVALVLREIVLTVTDPPAAPTPGRRLPPSCSDKSLKESELPWVARIPDWTVVAPLREAAVLRFTVPVPVLMTKLPGPAMVPVMEIDAPDAEAGF